MINTTNLSQAMAQIFASLGPSISQRSTCKETLNYIAQVQKIIVNEHENIMKLPQDQKDKIMTAYYNLNDLGQSVYRYNALLEAGLGAETDAEAKKIIDFIDILQSNSFKRPINYFHSNEQTMEIAKFMQKHLNEVGLKQAVKDFQLGMNLLNKNKSDSPIEAKRPLQIDGDFGEKTLASFSNICKNYPLRIVNKYIKRGAVNNAVFDTKNDRNIDTQKRVNTILNNLKSERKK